MNLVIRKLQKEDVPQFFRLIKEMAIYEKRGKEVKITEEDLIADGFGKNSLFGAIVAAVEDRIVGFIVYYFSYSTWKGKSIYLHELFVDEKFRKMKVGTKLFESVLEIAKKEKVGRVEWRVLNWNKPAIDFYNKYNTKMESEWIECELTKEQVRSFEKKK